MSSEPSASFHNVRFPLGISFGATGGPEWKNEILTLVSGHEKRNARWAHSRRHYDAGTGIRSLVDLRQVLSFFEARRGSLYAFRFHDPFDNKSANYNAENSAYDQKQIISDGKTECFQLVKNYEDYTRPITKPVEKSVKLAVDGAPFDNFEVDYLSGNISFSPDDIPHAGAVITAGFAFDVAVRFNTDQLLASITSFQAGEIPSIPIIEVKA